MRHIYTLHIRYVTYICIYIYYVTLLSHNNGNIIIIINKNNNDGNCFCFRDKMDAKTNVFYFLFAFIKLSSAKCLAYFLRSKKLAKLITNVLG